MALGLFTAPVSALRSRFPVALGVTLVTIAALSSFVADGNPISEEKLYAPLPTLLADAPDSWSAIVIVTLSEPPTADTMGGLQSAVGYFEIVSNTRSNEAGAPWSVIPAFAANLTKTQILGLSERSEVLRIEKALGLELATLDTEKVITGVDAFRTTYTSITGDMAGDGTRNYTANDLTVCVLDTGINDDHADFQANSGQQILWFDALQLSNTPTESAVLPHGTYVSGILGGQGNIDSTYQGVAPGVRILMVRVTTTLTDETLSGTVANAIDGIDYCVENKAEENIKVISISLGALATSCSDPSPSLSEAAEAAWDAGLVVVAAAGNQGPGTCTILSPAWNPSIIGVGMASDPDNPSCTLTSETHGWFLNKGSSRGGVNGPLKPDILAPGVCITTTNGAAGGFCTLGENYCTIGGTSAATPFISGVAALMIHANHTASPSGPNLTPDDVKRILMDTAAPAGPSLHSMPPYNYDWGAGIVRAYDAIVEAANASSFTGAGPGYPNHYRLTEDLTAADGVDEWQFSVTSTSRFIVATTILPTSSELSTSTADLKVSLVKGLCVRQPIDSAGSRQVLLTFDPSTAGCGTGTYTFKVTLDSSISQNPGRKYWLDLVGNFGTPSLVSDQ